MIFIGYDQGSKGFLFMQNNNTIYHGAQATFFETWFPRCKSTESGEGSKPDKPVQSDPEKPDSSRPSDGAADSPSDDLNP